MYQDPRSDLRRWDEDKPRTLQRGVGPSDTGGCRRQHAYRWHGTPPDDDTRRAEAAARLGSLVHKGYAAVIEEMEDPSRQAEVWVEFPGLPTPGRADDVDYARHICLDLKTTSNRAWHSWSTYGLPDRMWDQVEIYAYGINLVEAEPADWTLAILLINRETGEERRFERPADFERGQRLAEALIAEQHALEASESPFEFPRDGAGPGRGMPCDWCPWLRQCWGPGRDGMSPQATTIAENAEEVAAHARRYLEAGDVARKAKRLQDDARAFLDGLPAGAYEDVVIDWTGGNPRPAEPDPDAMAEQLLDLGIPVPYRPGGRTRRAIRVTRMQRPDAALGKDAGPHVTGHTSHADDSDQSDPPGLERRNDDGLEPSRSGAVDET